MRSQSNYAHRLADELHARLTDLSVSGATLLNIATEPQELGGRVYAPQLDALPGDADVVTFTAGGNDLGYIGNMMQDALRQTMLGSLVHWLTSSTSSLANPASRPVDADELSRRFNVIIDGVFLRAPKAEIFLLEYLPVLGRETRAGTDVSLTQAQIDHYRRVADVLRQGYRLAVASHAHVHLVEMTTVGEYHGLGSAAPWVNGFSYRLLASRAAFHPNQRGMDAVAEETLKVMRKLGWLT